MKSTQPADVDPDEFDSLNHEFYGADPAEVINARLWMFVAFLADESASVQVPFDDTALERTELPSETDRTEFAVLESMLILHRSAETLLRLYFAHEMMRHVRGLRWRNYVSLASSQRV